MVQSREDKRRAHLIPPFTINTVFLSFMVSLRLIKLVNTIPMVNRNPTLTIRRYYGTEIIP
jgi:hypothetical protein